MRRREFITLLGGVAAMWPLAARAQQARLSPHIGVLLNAFSPREQAPQAFLQGLRDAGYSVGGDVVIEWRAAHGDRSRLPELAADLVQRKVDVIVVDSTPGAQAAKNATSTIPIVLALVVDPVGSGLVASLQRPGGNVTGLSMMTPELAGKRLQLLKEAIPSLPRVGVLRNPDFAFHTEVVKDLIAAAPSLSIELSFADARTPEEFGPALSVVSRARGQALYVVNSPEYRSLVEQSGSVAISSTPQEFQKVINETVEKVAPIVQEFSLQLD
jgi:putative ABC transport system substrate-binding protein